MKKPVLTGDFRFVLICILICVGSLWIGTSYFYRAFPEASIDFRVDRLSSQPIAAKFLASQGLDTSGYLHASAFQYDNQSKVFIERELGLKKANALMKNQVHLWRWGHRWFKPKQKEEFRAEISTSGEVVSFSHILPENAPGADLSADIARSLAESFLVLEMNLPIDSLEYVDVQSEKQINRTDHILTWKVLGVDLKPGSYRISVTVQGDRIGGCREFVRIPEEWSRGYARLRSLNETATQFDLIIVALLGIGLMVAFGKHVQLRNVRWKTALAFGVIALVLQFLSSLNEFPAAKYGFDTASTYGGFLSRVILVSFLSALAYGVIIFMLTASAEPVFRQACPQSLSITRMFSWQAIRSRSFFKGSLVGIALTFFFFAYEIGFYLLANAFGAWAPADVPYSDLLNTKFPWIFVLLGGFFPAVSEEWMFRAFSIPFLQKLLSRRWVAVVLASVIWGFGHAGYPNQPFFIRGLEVGIVGLILSWAMFRYGILAPLIAHYSIDAFYSAFLLLRSGNTYLVTSGAITAGINLLPFLIALGAYLFTRRFSDESAVLNQSEETPSPLPSAPGSEESISVPAYQRLSPGKRALAAVLLVLGITALFFRAPRFAGEARFRISGSQAIHSAETFLTKMGFNLEGCRTAVQPQNRVDSMASQYIFSKKGIEGLNSIYGPQIAPLVWESRFYKPLQKEEYRVSIDPADGIVTAFHHYLSEEDAGAMLSIRKAQQIASSFVSDRGYALSQYRLKEASSENRSHRRDMAFTWEARPGTRGAVEDARLRIDAAVYGDKVGEWNQSIKIPEGWKRTRESKNFLSTTILWIRTAFIISILILATATLARATRRGMVRWKIAGKVAAVVLVLEFLNILNGIPSLRFQYDTQVAMSVHLVTGLAQELLLLMGIVLAAAVAVSLVMACYPDASVVLQKSGTASWGRDCAICVAATLGAYLILQWMISEIQYRAPNLMIVPALSLPTGIGTYVPFISDLRNVVLSAIFFSTVVVFAIHLWRRFKGRPVWRTVLAAGMLFSLVPASARGISEVVVEAIPAILLVSFACIMVSVFLRNNYLAYLVCAAVLALAQLSLVIFSRGNTTLVVQVWLMWSLMLAGLTLLADPLKSLKMGNGK
jgi:membrane protease YdiL (CAAX protease family)